MHIEELAKRIEHTILKPYATLNDIKRYCEEAVKYGFRAVYVPPCYVKYAKDIVKGKGVLIGTVIGFPLGYTPTDIKVEEAIYVLREGADAIDIVMNIALFKSGRCKDVVNELKEITDIARRIKENVEVKVIIETSLLTENEIIKATELVVESKADYVKTCTGFGPRGVEIKDIRIIRKVLEEHNVYGKVKIKASGGIRTYTKALMLLKEGAHVLGTSTGVDIIKSKT